VPKNYNPVPEAREGLGKINSEPTKVFTPAQVNIILREAGRRPPEHKARAQEMLQCFVYIAAYCGLRLGEILALPVSRVNFATGDIEVRHSISRCGEYKGPKSNNGIRDFPMPNEVRGVILNWLRKYYLPNPRELVFHLRECHHDL